MPSWDEIINQVESAPNGVIDITRKEYISKLAEIRGRNVICYYSGWLQDSQGVQETSLLDTDMTGFMTNVHELDRSKGLDLILHTPRRRSCCRGKAGGLSAGLLRRGHRGVRASHGHVSGNHDRLRMQEDLHGETIVDWSHRPAIQWYTSRRRSERLSQIAGSCCSTVSNRRTPDALRPATRRSVRAIASNAEQAESSKPSIRGSTSVSYTHLTLPTNMPV